jgi:hypothetical protein
MNKTALIEPVVQSYAADELVVETAFTQQPVSD